MHDLCTTNLYKQGVVGGIKAHVQKSLPRQETDAVSEQIVEVAIVRVSAPKRPENAVDK